MDTNNIEDIVIKKSKGYTRTDPQSKSEKVKPTPQKENSN